MNPSGMALEQELTIRLQALEDSGAVFTVPSCLADVVQTSLKARSGLQTSHHRADN